jgi:hypothetical protein
MQLIVVHLLQADAVAQAISLGGLSSVQKAKLGFLRRHITSLLRSFDVIREDAGVSQGLCMM